MKNPFRFVCMHSNGKMDHGLDTIIILLPSKVFR